ncbi:MAG: hypothetical protein HN742_34410 [Lentisphaerae bacterium]|jgi:hypothetical protein|nr:hypothetical protein [Lentisphaerota bacterium]MBT5605052.1 hypothetical protein [Lentisphaerota bacterium]MBT7058674.1 hypothetical protein [Lentisphaerota bacterium]MBT7847015.1 hypothetical protein [Lentisphaerota bacterium]
MSLRRYRLRRTLGVCALLIGTLTEAETVVLDTMDADQAAWGPGRAEMTHVQEGKGALKWAPSEGVLQRDDLCVDLGSFNSLRLWIHAKAATFARIKLTVPVRDGRTFSTVFRIDWRGWNRMELPEWRLAVSGGNRAAGWKNTQGIRFELVQPGFEPTELVLDGLEQSTEWARIPINDHEVLIDWMYFGARGRHLWQPTAETRQQPAGSYGLDPFWSWGTMWVREDARKRDVCAYERRFDTPVADWGVVEVRVSNDSAGAISIGLQVDGVWTTPVQHRPGRGRFDAIEIPLALGAKVLNAVRLDLSEPPDAIDGPHNRQLKCNVHWVLLRKRGAPRGEPPVGMVPIAPVPLASSLEEGGLPGAVYFGREDLPRIRALFTEGLGKPLWQKLKGRAEGLLNASPERFVGVYNPGANWVMTRIGKASGDVSRRARDCALAYVISGDKRYADHARRALLSLCRIEQWTDGPFARYPLGWGGYGNPFTEASVTYDAGLALDWIYNALPPAERKEVSQAILRKGVWWTFDRLKSSPGMLKMNQGVVFDSEIGCAMIVLAALDPTLEAMRRQTEEWIWQGIEAYSLRDGASTEGVGYWNYTWNTAVKLLAALAARDPADFRDRCPGNVRRSMDWIVHMKSNGAAGFVPLAICDSRGSMPGDAVSALFAKYLQNPTAAWFQDKHGSPKSELAAFMWAHGTVAAEPPMAPARYFRGAGYVFLREGFRHGDFLFGLLGQPRLAGHWQSDRSAFMLEAFGEYLAMDPGMMSYSNPIHRAMANTRLHNAITIDGGNSTHADATVTAFFSSPAMDYAAVDATAAYPKASSLTRHAFYIRPDHVVLFDTVALRQPGRIEWNFNSAGQLSFNAHRLLASGKKGTLVADVFNGSTEVPLHVEMEDWPCGYPGLTNHHATLHVGPQKGQTFLTSLWPVRKGTEGTVQTERLEGKGFRGVRLRRGSSEEYVVVRTGPDEVVCNGVASDAVFAFVRLEGGQPTAAAFVDGTWVGWRDQHLLDTTARATASWDSRGAWAAFGVQAPAGTGVMFASFHGAGVPVARIGSVAGQWQAANVEAEGARAVFRVPDGVAPQGGWWLIAGQNEAALDAAVARVAIEETSAIADGEVLAGSTVPSNTIPHALQLRLTLSTDAPRLRRWGIYLNGRDVPAGQYTIRRTNGREVTIDLAPADLLTDEEREPEFLATHVIEVETRADNLLRTRLSANCRFTIPPVVHADAVFLSDLGVIKEFAHTPPIKQMVHGGIIRDQAYTRDRLRLVGVEFPKGLTTHPETTGAQSHAEVIYDMTPFQGKRTTFKATVGVQQGSPGSVTFHVFVRKANEEWREAFKTGVMAEDMTPRNVSIPITGVDQLRLYVTDGNDGINSDHAVWAMARLE